MLLCILSDLIFCQYLNPFLNALLMLKFCKYNQQNVLKYQKQKHFLGLHLTIIFVID